jgi:pilus assembly protein Flp/PilA
LSQSGHTIASVTQMRLLSFVHAPRISQRGQGLVQYGLILMLIAIIVLSTLLLLGETVHDMYHNVSHAMPH